MHSVKPCFLAACSLLLLALPLMGNCQGPFVEVDVPDFGALPEAANPSETLEVSSSGVELDNGSFAPMFPVVFTATLPANIRSCKVRVSSVQPENLSDDLETYNFDTFSTESTCTLRFLPYTLQDSGGIAIEFEVGLLSSDDTVSSTASASIGRGPVGGSCTTSTPVVREFLDPVEFSCTGFESQDGSSLLAYVTSVAFLGRDEPTQNDDDDDDDDDDDNDNTSGSGPLVGSTDSYSVRSLAVNEFEAVPLSFQEDIDTSNIFVDVRDNGSLDMPSNERRFYFHFVDTSTGAHHRERLTIQVESISDVERDNAIKDIYRSTLQPYIGDIDAFRALNVSRKFAYTYQYYLVASSIRNRLSTDHRSVSKDQVSILRSLASFSEDMTTAFLEDPDHFSVSPIVLALEAVIMPFSDSTAISYEPDVYAGAMRSVDRLLNDAPEAIASNPYNQAALVRVTSAAVEGLDKIKTSSSRTGTLLTPEVATMTRGLVARIQDAIYPSLLCGAPAFFDRNNYITLLHQVNTVATFVRTPLVLPVGQQKDTEFVMPAVAFAGTDSTDAGCLLYDLSDMSDRLFPAASSSQCRLSVSTCTFREAFGTFSEQAIQTPSDDPIMITFNVPDNCEPSDGNPCQFFLPGSNSWSSAGCKPVSQSKGELVCACTHLTDFTALMDSTNEGGSSSNGVAAQVSNVYWWLSLGFVLAAIVIVVVVAVVHDFFRIRKRRRIYRSMTPQPISGDGAAARQDRRTLENSSI